MFCIFEFYREDNGLSTNNIIDSTFNELYSKYEPYIRSLCEYKLENSPGYIDDCIQDVFLDLYDALKKEKEITYYKAWLSKVANNKIKDIYTQINRDSDKIIPIEIEKIENLYTNSIEEEVFWKEKEKHLAECKKKILEDFNFDEQKLLKNRYKFKKSISQIAKEEKTTENNIYQRLFRLRVKAKMLIKKYLDE